MKTFIKVVLCITIALANYSFCIFQTASGSDTEWTCFGGTSDNRRTISDVHKPSDNLVKYDDFGADVGIISTKLVFNRNRIYAGSRNSKLYCLDATTGWRIWEFKTGEQIVSAPAIEKDLLYFGSDDGIFYCIQDLQNRSQEVWRYNAGDDIKTIPVIFADSICFGSNNKKIVCLDKRYGKQKWTASTNGVVRSSPIFYNNKIFVGCDDKKLYCIDANNGKLLWKASANGIIESSPCIYGNSVIVGSNDGNVYAFSILKGNRIWISPTGGSVKSSPIIGQSKLYIGSDDGYLYCLNPVNGSIIWKFQTKGAISAIPVFSDSNVFIGSSDGYQYSLDVSNGKQEWVFKTDSSIFTGAAIVDDKIFFGDISYMIYCLKKKTGEKIWEFRTGWYIRSSPVLYEDSLFFGSDDGRLYILDNQSLALKWSYMTKGQIWSTPAVHKNLVIFGSSDTSNISQAKRDNYVYCLDYKTKNSKPFWKIKTGNISKSSPIIINEKVFIGSEDGYLYCIGLFSGTVLWKYRCDSAILATPSYYNGRIYIGSSRNAMYCLDEKNGKLLWRFTPGEGILSAAAIYNGRVYFGSYSNYFYCLDAITGKKIWNLKTGFVISSSPAISNGKVFFSSQDSNIYCCDTNTGKRLWTFNTGAMVLSSPTVCGDRLYCGSLDYKIYSIDTNTGKMVWNYRTEGNIWTSPAVFKQKVYIGSDDFKMYVFAVPVKSKDIPIEQSLLGSCDDECTTVLTFGFGKTSWAKCDIQPSPMATSPVILNNSTYMVVRYITESINCNLYWDGQAKKITIFRPFDNRTIILQVNSRYAFVNGLTVPIDPNNDKIKPIIRDGLTLVPLRFVATALDMSINVDNDNGIIKLIYKDPSKNCSKAHNFSGTDIQNNQFTLSSHIGKPVLVSFLSTGSLPSLDALSSLVKLHQTYADKIVFVTICLDTKDTEQVKNIRDDFEANWSFIIDDGSISKLYGISELPSFVAIDSAGKVFRSFSGDLEVLEQVAQELK